MSPAPRYHIKVNDSAHGPCPKPGPICYALRSILTEFQDLSSSIRSNIITLPTSGKSIVIKNIRSNIIFYFRAFCGS